MYAQNSPRVLLSRQEIAAKVKQLEAELGMELQSPFSTLSFLALPVIPELRLTDLGMVDVYEFKLIE